MQCGGGMKGAEDSKLESRWCQGDIVSYVMVPIAVAVPLCMFRLSAAVAVAATVALSLCLGLPLKSHFQFWSRQQARCPSITVPRGKSQFPVSALVRLNI